VKPHTAFLLAGLGVGLAACATQGAQAPDRYAAPTARPNLSHRLPLGGPHTISLSITDCAEDCPVVNVMIDPDNYWQRTADSGATSGTAPDGLYAAITEAFLAQGFNETDSELTITKDNPDTCPQYLERGHVYFMHIGRGETGQRIDYDTACNGSLDARRAENLTAALAELSDLTHIFEGAVTLEDTMGDEE
jgi:hypothetical protein